MLRQIRQQRFGSVQNGIFGSFTDARSCPAYHLMFVDSSVVGISGDRKADASCEYDYYLDLRKQA